MKSLKLSRFALAVAATVALSSCSILGGPGNGPSTIYAPRSAVAADSAWPTVNWSLTIAQPTAARIIDGVRIAVRPSPGELQVYKGAVWAQSSTAMLEDALVRTLEDSGRISSVARADAGIRADYRLITDLRRFESDYAGQSTPKATIEISAKLMRVRDQHVVASRVFQQAVPASGTEVPRVVEAFDQGIAPITRDIAGWTLTSGNTDLAASSRVSQR